MVTICSLYVITSVFFLLPAIYKNVDQEKWFDIRKQYLNFFIKYAVEMGYHAEDKLIDIFDKKFLDDIGYT